MSEKAEEISQWIKTEVHKAGMRGAVVGLSGGIDSAVTAALCKRALGDNVIGVIMPCYSGHLDEEDALQLAVHLKVQSHTVRLDSVLDPLLRELPNGTKMATANLKPKLRMATLYHFANRLSYLVVGTGNKTELKIGYFTKYGDGGVDLLPLGGFYKTEVRKLAAQLGIPKRIIDKVPSAGLWDGQTDEGELGISYTELDETLQAIETDRTGHISPQTLSYVQRMISVSRHKCEVPRTFGVR